MNRGARRAAVALLAAGLGTLSPCDAGTELAAGPAMRATSADFLELVRSRRSIRAYSHRDVEAHQLGEILEAARAAPSAGNLQGYEIVVVRDAARREQLARAAFGQGFVAKAPVVLVFVTDPARSAERYGDRGATLYSVQDAAIAASYAQLAATALGLGSVWVGAFDEAAVLAVAGARPPRRAVSLLVIGHPNEAPGATPRRPLTDLVRQETFAAPWLPGSGASR